MHGGAGYKPQTRNEPHARNKERSQSMATPGNIGTHCSNSSFLMYIHTRWQQPLHHHYLDKCIA